MHAIRKAFPPENAADLFRQFCGRFRGALQGIIQLQFIPFESPHLVEREHVHAFHVAQERRIDRAAVASDVFPTPIPAAEAPATN